MSGAWRGRGGTRKRGRDGEKEREEEVEKERREEGLRGGGGVWYAGEREFASEDEEGVEGEVQG